jgi:oligopeptide transport system substrate-binding protein
MNNAMAPFDDQRVRQAFAMAIDRNAYVEGVLQGAGKPATSWIPPGMPAYNPELGKQYDFNPPRAKQLLASAGYPEGRGFPKVTFLAVANDTNRIVGQFIEDQLKRNLNVEVSHEFVDSRTYGTRFTANQHQVTIQRWNADWPYPDNWLPDIFGSEGLNNHAAYRSAKFDELVKKAAQEVDEKKRLVLYNEAHKVAIDDAAIAPLYNPQTYILVKPRVKNLILTALDGGIKGDYNLYKAYIGASDN